MASRATRLRIDVRHDVRRCLSQKSCYANYADALSGADRLMETGRVNPGHHITPYLCWDCQRWHVWNRPIHFPKGHSSTW